ncbi:MAG: rod shape-determining protein MreC [Methylophaga sp.]|nr:MAG: rod shape-determining protein MreC [Methylophaga sp.]
MKPLFSQAPSLNARLLLALIASLALFVLDSRFNYFASVRVTLATVLYPVQVVAALPSDLSNWTSEFFQDREQLRNRNNKLESMQLLSSMRLQKLQALERENMRLRELLGSSFRLTERVLVAELLTIDLDPSFQQVVVNKGKKDGVFIGQSALDANGVMGQVTEVYPFSSRIVLLTDPSHGIPIQINRNGLRAVATGRGLAMPLQLEHLPHNVDIREGDLLVTSGLGGRFPVGYPVGTVKSVHFPKGRAFAEIAIEPAAHLSTSRELLLVLPTERLVNTSRSEVSVEQADDAE